MKIPRKLKVTAAVLPVLLAFSHAAQTACRQLTRRDLSNSAALSDADNQDILNGLDALNGQAYPTGGDGFYGSRDMAFTEGWMGDISRRVKDQFNVIEVVTCENGERDGLHSVLLRHRKSGQKIFAVCGMEPAHISHDLGDVFNSLYIIPPSLPGQFPDVVEAYDALTRKHGTIDLVAGHSIGGILVQLLAAGRDTKVVSFASAGLCSGLVEDTARYFGISQEQAAQHMKDRCVSVSASIYAALGQQAGKEVWAGSPWNYNIMDHGTYQLDRPVHDGQLTSRSAGAAAYAAPIALLGAEGLVFVMYLLWRQRLQRKSAPASKPAEP